MVAISLHARGPDGWALPGVEHPELNARLICRARHHATQRINLPDQMTFADTTDRGVARHLTESVDGMSD